MSKPATAQQSAPEVEFLGITDTECCLDCTPDCCVITHAGICAHPFKSGLQSIHRTDAEINGRYRRAKKHLLLERMKREAANG